MTDVNTAVADLIGIPFVEHGRSCEGADCWGLVRLALRRGFGLEVPDYTEDYVTTTDREEIARLIAQEAMAWIPVLSTDAKPGDVVLFRIRGSVSHAGLVLDPPWFLHTQIGIESVRERWDSPLWRRRISGCVRHPALQASTLGRQ